MLEAEDDRTSARRATSSRSTCARRPPGELVPLANLVQRRPSSPTPATLNRYDRLRAITISANLAPGYTLGEALEFLNGVVKDDLNSLPGWPYKGESREFLESAAAMLFVFGISLLLVYLVLAAQFESFLQPIVILMTVPLAVFGGLLGLWLTGVSLNSTARSRSSS